MTVAAYVRVSTDDQTTALQRDEVGRYVEARRLSGVEWYADEGISGATRSRPGLDRLLADVQRGRVRRVVVYKLDRLGRDLSHLLVVLDEFRARDVVLVSITEGIDTGTPVGRLLYTIIAALAEFERSIIKERIAAGIAAARQRGIVIGRPLTLLPGQIERAVEKVRAGHSKRKVAAEFGIARSTLRAYLAKNPSPPATPAQAKQAVPR